MLWNYSNAKSQIPLFNINIYLSVIGCIRIKEVTTRHQHSPLSAKPAGQCIRISLLDRTIKARNTVIHKLQSQWWTWQMLMDIKLESNRAI